MDIDNRRLTAFLIGFSGVMLGLILYHVLAADELAYLRYRQLSDLIEDEFATLPARLAPDKSPGLTEAPEAV